jgi:pyruvate/2-oxoglutarate dehydrogenase complex dihydrolipoamide dehydrogenase (E3) component
VSYTRGEEQASLETDAVFLMVGWPANLSGLNLEAAGIELGGPYIKVNEHLQTNIPEIFVAGDANGVSMFVQSALQQGAVAAQNAVGLTEAQAREKHADCLVEVVTYDTLPRAVMDGKTDGFCKLIVDSKTLELLGAHVLGSYSAEVIQVAATCMAAGMTVSQIARLELAFPTFTEAIGIAARRIVRTLRLEGSEGSGNDISDAMAAPA